MDKKNTIIGVILLGAGIFLMSHQARQTREAAERQRAIESAAQEAITQGENESEPNAANAGNIFDDAGSDTAKPGASGGLFQTAENQPAVLATTSETNPEETYILENNHIRVTFSSRGGAIKQVEFIDRGPDGKLKYPAKLGGDTPYVFNEGSDIPALAISLDQDANGKPEEYAPDYIAQEVNQADLRIQFAFQSDQGGAIIRAYKLPGEGSEADPYLIEHETYFVNTGDRPLDLEAMYINVGTAPPTAGDVTREFLNFGYYTTAGKTTFLKMPKFTGRSGFLGIGASMPRDFIAREFSANGQGEVLWASIKNQFFASVLTPKKVLGTGIFARPVDLSATIDNPKLQKGLTGSMGFNLGRVPVGERKAIQATYYVGPKEFFRLNTLGADQDKIMQFGFFGGISKVLLWALVGIHDLIAPLAPTWGWGFAIVFLTIIIKAILWPLTQVQVKSAKRMATIQEPMKALQEKHKDNPQKLQQEMAKLFKESKVNPAAGCLPILVQIPIFFALFYMLRTSSDLRFAPFLWIKDLSVPDTLPFMPDWFHLLPLLMGAAMWFQMKMTPTPTTDNMQRKLFQFMPLIFLAFCYQFPSGLVLYWTVQNGISILQQWLTNRSREPDEAVPVVSPTTTKAPTKKATATSPAKTVGGAKKSQKKGPHKAGKKRR